MYQRVVQFRADVLGEFRTAQHARARLRDINRPEPVIQHAVNPRFNPLRFNFQTKRFAQQQHRGKNRTQRASDVFAGKRWRRAVNWFVQCRLAVALRRHQP